MTERLCHAGTVVWGTMLLLLGLWLSLPGYCSAAEDITELNYFNCKIIRDDSKQDILQIELGINRDRINYRTANKLYLPEQLVLKLDDTVPGRLKHEMILDGEYGKRILVQETEPNRTQISIIMNFPVTEDNYKIYTLEADQEQKKPFRLVIEIKHSIVKAVGLDGAKGHKIVLDAGHGGSDSGAIGPHGIKEKDISLAVTKKVRDLLQGAGAKVIMTRETDRDVYAPNDTDTQELQARVDVGKRAKGTEIFVSIHCNAFHKPEAHGMETYYYPKTANDKRLATLLNEELAVAGGLFNRGVKEAKFYVMRNSAMPASLVELAFITNYKEEKLLNDPSYQTTLAEAIAKGIARYFGE